ncbi:hypothetical protein LCGC14_2884790 [marine sediment metagenome]|uniref:Uncharacterized protein n=1 Tax=marine sediment metagenome TaxID=412755 RepID=A0A0F9AQ39_9ZZZZ
MTKKELSEYRKRYYQKNKEKLKERSRLYRQENPEACKEYNEKYIKTEKGKENCNKALRKYQCTEKGKRSLRRAEQEQKRISPEKYKARYLLQNAVAQNRIVHPDTCGGCGELKIVEGHHPDYDKPLDVEWLCGKCHRALHRELISV